MLLFIHYSGETAHCPIMEHAKLVMTRFFVNIYVANTPLGSPLAVFVYLLLYVPQVSPLAVFTSLSNTL